MARDLPTALGGQGHEATGDVAEALEGFGRMEGAPIYCGDSLISHYIKDSLLNNRDSMESTRRIIPVSKWLITMVIVSPLSRVVGPLPNGRFMAYKWG